MTALASQIPNDLLILQAEHLASRPGYLALAVDGATPGPGLAACSDGGVDGATPGPGLAACSDGGIPAQCR